MFFLRYLVAELRRRKARLVSASLTHPGAVTDSPARRERRITTCVAPSARAARNGIAADSPASLKRLASIATGGPASSGSAADARSAVRSERGSSIVSWRSTGSPVETSVAIGWRSVPPASTASNRPGESCS